MNAKQEQRAKQAAEAAVGAARAAIDDTDTAIGTVRPPSVSAERARETMRVARALPAVHRVKSWPEQFRAALTGRKRFEIRRDDRNYQTGDTIELLEYTPNLQQLDLVPGGGQPGSFTGRAAMFVIGYISRGGPVPAGWCAFDLISTDDLNRLEGVRR
jgi:hypothetical protein